MATTKTDPKLSVAGHSGRKSHTHTYDGLTREQLLETYRIMYTSRRIDDREIMLKRQQKIFFQMSGAGHEAIGVAAGMTLKAGYDWAGGPEGVYLKTSPFKITRGGPLLAPLSQGAGVCAIHAAGGLIRIVITEMSLTRTRPVCPYK